jgi:hypothetical protein
MDEQVKPILKSFNDDLPRVTNRALRITSENKIPREEKTAAAACCENGICTLNWKPKRTA